MSALLKSGSDKIMSIHFRIVALTLLLISLVFFSGAAQACLIFVDQAAARDTCCLSVDDKLPEEPSSPCSSPECHCLGCSGALFQPHILITRVAFINISISSTEVTNLPSGFPTHIDYPPELIESLPLST